MSTRPADAAVSRHDIAQRPLSQVPACAALLALLCLSTATHAITGSTSTTAFKNVDEGVQFAPNWVLSASHVGFSIGGMYSNGHGSALVDAVYTPPGAGFPNHDLQLVHLATPIAAAPALALSGTLFSPTAFDLQNPSLNIDVTLTSNNNSVPGPRSYAFGQVREFADTLLDDHDNNANTPPLLRTVNWLIVHQNSFGAPYVQSGDSGGGLFFGHVTDQTSPLIGIASTLLTGVNGANSFASGYVSVASYRGWIDATMTANASDDQLAQWVSTPVPEPASWALWFLGAAVFAATAHARCDLRSGQNKDHR